jgi:hypothetical protein
MCKHLAEDKILQLCEPRKLKDRNIKTRNKILTTVLNILNGLQEE